MQQWGVEQQTRHTGQERHRLAAIVSIPPSLHHSLPPSLHPFLNLLGLTVLVVCVAECVLAVRVAAVVVLLVLLVVVMMVVDLAGVGRLILFDAELV